MKTTKFVGTVLSACLLLMATAACSTFQGSKSSEELATTGPTIVMAKAEPGTYELNANLQPATTAEVFADVKDFQAPVRDVRVRFLHIPIELKMNQLQGTTWRAQLTTQQLKRLAVSGQTMKYQAEIVATDSRGMTAISQKPIEIAVKAPEPGQLRQTG